MKRTIPLLIAALAGCVLVASRFIPFTETWGETTAVWFDILEGVAFILGGGSLLKLQLKKISDRKPGWGYSAITLAAFVVTLFAGLGKIGVPPNPAQQFYGQSLAPLAVADLPQSTVARVAGIVPPRADGEQLPLIVGRQFGQENGQLVFRGWMTPQQKAELSEYQNTLAWQCTVEKLFDAAQPPPAWKGQIEFLVNHNALSCTGVMADDVRDALLKLNGNERWQEAVASLYQQSHVEKKIPVPQAPSGFDIPAAMRSFVTYDAAKRELAIRGPMSTGVRDALARDHFPMVHPTTVDERARFRADLESHGGPLNKQQTQILENLLKAGWTVDPLRIVLDDAGKAVPVPPTACSLQAAQKAGREAEPPPKGEKDVVLNERQRGALEAFARDRAESPQALAERLRALGPFTGRQAAALNAFFAKVPTVGEKKRDLCVELLRAGPLTRDQRQWLLADYREEYAWRQTIGRLFVQAHVPIYPWSGQYSVSNSTFGWLYEYMLKPLVATMFSLLAFYVASAAFRAFRAKNLEAILLLGTAFIILLGQTFAGYWLTAWLPENPAEHWTALLRIENLRVLIMKVFQTAGQRAIMIGIALGLAATSLKVLLGIDRSYLGSGGN